MEAFGHTGVEGLVVKGAASRYEPGKRSWIKVNSDGMRCVWFLRNARLAPGQRAA
ncbi:MAG TPA: hypothetical protein VGD71_18350 [Kribbella sp.]